MKRDALSVSKIVNDSYISFFSKLFEINLLYGGNFYGSFQIWDYNSIFLKEPPYGLSMIITGTDYQLENISNLFKRNFNHIGECSYFFGNDQLINLKITS